MVENPRMKASLDHLPARKRAELLRVVETLKSAFAEAIETRKAERLKNGRILKIILYGSYARGDWVEDPVGRYFSDFDILIIVDHEDLTDGEFWEGALWRTTPGVGRMRTPVSFIVHSLDDVNRQLERGRSFFVDILEEGVVLENLPGVRLIVPGLLPPKVVWEEAREAFDEWFVSAGEFEAGSSFYAARGNLKLAAFHLHQSVEHYYHCLLLVLTQYSPKSHNLVFLRRRCEPLDRRLLAAWPNQTKFERRCFELLRAAYVKARYSKHYRVNEDELAWLTDRVVILRDLARQICEERLSELKDRADAT